MGVLAHIKNFHRACLKGQHQGVIRIKKFIFLCSIAYYTYCICRNVSKDRTLFFHAFHILIDQTQLSGIPGLNRYLDCIIPDQNTFGVVITFGQIAALFHCIFLLWHHSCFGRLADKQHTAKSIPKAAPLKLCGISSKQQSIIKKQQERPAPSAGFALLLFPFALF